MRRLVPTFIAFFILAAPAEAAWQWPVSGEVITPYRNGSDPYATGQHRGIDIAVPVGTPVRAAAAGEVRFAGAVGSSGLTIGVRTDDGYDTSYLHLSALDVREGAHVSAGERIGAVGTTGSRSAAAPHLHFGVRDAGTRHAYHDPLAFLPPAPPASPAPEPPAPSPAPRPAPAPPSPMPAPAPRGAPAPIPRSAPAPVPRGAPGPRRAPIPRSAPGPRRMPVPRGVPGPDAGPAPVPGAEPLPSRHRIPAPARPGAVRWRSPHRAPSRWPRSNPIPRDARARAERAIESPRDAPGSPGTASSERAVQPLATSPVSGVPQAGGAPREDRGGGGPDIGWVLACAGLLLAGAVLGLAEDGRRATGRTPSRLLAALPAFGRR